MSRCSRIRLQKPSTMVPILKQLVLWGRVENAGDVGRTPGRTPQSAAGPPASLPRCVENFSYKRVFIAFGGPQCHADRLANLRPIGKSACFVGQPILAARRSFQPARFRPMCGARTHAQYH